jgi:hypothetical protein
MRQHLISTAAAIAMLLPQAATAAAASEPCVKTERVLDRPIIHPELDDSITRNIQGPSLIRVPDWVEGKLGKYYLYFASHQGQNIRMAYANDLKGPWTVHKGGVLPLAQSYFPTAFDNVLPEMRGRDGYEAHIASPDVHVDEVHQRILLYYHGQTALRVQNTRVAISKDGLQFEARPEELGHAYMRVFQHDRQVYSMAMPGIFYRSKDGLTQFEKGPTLFASDQRHTAILKRGKQLLIFWTRAGDAPERIYLSRVDIDRPWDQWKASDPEEILRPELSWEGADAPIEPSKRGTAHGYFNQLRDPAIFEENGETFLLYAGAAESGIGLAKLTINDIACRIAP